MSRPAVKAAFVTPYLPDAPHEPGWVGYRSIGSLLAASLEREGVCLHAIGGFHEHGLLWRGARQAVRNLVSPRRYLRFVEPDLLRRYARALERRLAATQVDCVIAHGWLPVACAQLRVPLVLHNDAPLVQLIDYYPYYTGLDDTTLQRIVDAERAAIERSALVVYASDWAADGARRAYPSCADRIVALPYGPALSDASVPRAVDALPGRRLEQSQCELLFLGVDWQRKGGPLVLEIARRLHRSGLPVRLTIAGCTPPVEPADRPFVDLQGFIDGRTPQGAQRLAALLQRSAFLVLPVQAEAFGLVFAEAAACALPSLTTATGGVPSAVRDGVGGVLFPPDAGADDYCAAIRRLWNDSHAYTALALSARRDYDERLNWRRIGAQWAALLHKHGVQMSGQV